MSVDLIGWKTLKRIDFKKRLDGMLAAREEIEDSIKEFEPTFEKITDDQLKTGLRNWGKALMAFFQLQREQIIWTNAMIEGMIKLEERLDKIDARAGD